MNRPAPSSTIPRLAERPRLSVVIVNYNGWPDTERLVSALLDSPALADGRCEVLIVDNASAAEPPPSLLEPRAGVRLIRNGRNVGFAAGVNAGWRESRGDWLLLLNPDVVAGPGLAVQVLAHIDRFSTRPAQPPGVVGFALRNGDGTRQPSVGIEPSLWRSLRGQFIPRTRRKYQAASRTRSGPVDWVTGACLLVDGRLLRSTNGMDEDFFLYYEEVALCKGAWRAGRTVEFDDSLEVVHLRPLQARRVTPKLRAITRHSKLLYFRKYRPGLEFRILSRLVGIEAAVRRPLAAIAGDLRAMASWRLIGDVAREMRRGKTVRGLEVVSRYEAALTEGPDLLRDLRIHEPQPRLPRPFSAEPAAETPQLHDPASTRGEGRDDRQGG